MNILNLIRNKNILFVRKAFVLFILMMIFFGSSNNSFAQPGELLSASAKAAFEKGDFAPCVEEMSAIIIRAPNNDAALAERGRCYFLKSTNIPAKIAEKSKGISISSKAREAALAESKQERALAFSDAEKALSLNSNNPAALNIRGIIRNLNGDSDGALADFTKLIEIDPRSVKAYTNRVDVKIGRKDFDGALADLSKIIEINPPSAAANYFRRAQINVTYIKDIKSAVADYKKVISLDPSQINLIKEAADYFKSLNKYSEARELYDIVILREPRNDAAYAGRAFCSANLLDLERTIADMETALKINPKNVLALTARGYTKLRKNDFDGARADYETAIALDPNDKLASSMLEQLNADHPSPAMIKALQQKIAVYKKEAAESNQNFDVYEKLQKLFDELNIRGEGRYYFDIVTDKEPNNSCAAYFFARGDGTRVDEFETAFNSFDGKNGRRCSAEAAFYLGRLLTNTNGSEKAIRWFQAALERDPQIPAVASFLRKEQKNLDNTNSKYTPSNRSNDSDSSSGIPEAVKQKRAKRAAYANKVVANGEKLEELNNQLRTMSKEYYDDKTPVLRKKQLIDLIISNLKQTLTIINEGLNELSEVLTDDTRKFYTERAQLAKENLAIMNEDKKTF